MGARKLFVMTAVGSAITMLAVLLPSPAWATHNWAGNNCSWSGRGTDISLLRRSEAKSYGSVAKKEGYHWGGGCWNDNNRDNQAGDPVQTTSTHGEGGDCSGFTFKTWHLECSNPGTSGETCTLWENGKQRWSQYRYIHGAYTASTYKAASSAPVVRQAKRDALIMDAFASDSHVGMVWKIGTSKGQDQILEAKCEACGTGVWSRNYRGDSNYLAAQRTGWTPECYPNCV